MTKLLFLIASHKNPDQVVRLVDRLKRECPTATVLIHYDPMGQPLPSVGVSTRNDIHIFPNPMSVGWGEFSVVESELRCINWLHQRDFTFDWLVLLSGQDYPVRPLAELKTLLRTTTYDGFLEYFEIAQPPATAWNWDAHSGIDRYCYRYISVHPALKPMFYKLYRLVNWNPWLRVKAGRFGAKLALRRRTTPFTETFRCYAGSQWHILNRRCVDYIYNFVQTQPAIVDYYRHTMVPDESFFQTILVNNPELNLCNDNLRYISWVPPYPAIMQSPDFDILINSGKYFARKFDTAVDAHILDRLDAHCASAVKKM